MKAWTMRPAGPIPMPERYYCLISQLPDGTIRQFGFE